MGAVSRIYSQVYKNFKTLRGSAFRLFDVLAWPYILLFSITLFVGFVGGKRYMDMVILGIIGWRCVYHLQIDMVTSLTEEYWNNSIPHLMVSPIRRLEFILGGAISGAVKFLFVLATYLVIGHFLYAFHVEDYALFVVALFFLGVFGIVLGMISLGLIYIFQEDAFTVAFLLPDVLVLLSGVYYPTTVFPEPVYTLSQLLASTYAFDLLKAMVGMGSVSFGPLIILTLVWLGIGLVFNKLAYNYARRRGRLARLG